MYFTLTQMQFLMLALFGGVLLVLVVALGYWAWQLSLRRQAEAAEEEAETEEFADGLKEGHGRMPLLVTLVFAAVLVWAVAYVIAVALGGINVQ